MANVAALKLVTILAKQLVDEYSFILFIICLQAISSSPSIHKKLSTVIEHEDLVSCFLIYTSEYKSFAGRNKQRVCIFVRHHGVANVLTFVQINGFKRSKLLLLFIM